MQNHFGAVRSEERYSVDADLLREIKQVRQHIYIMHPIVTSVPCDCSSRPLTAQCVSLHHDFWFWKILALIETILLCLLLSAFETAAGRFKSFDQRYQRWLGRHQTHRARAQWQWTHERRHPELSLSYQHNWLSVSVLWKVAICHFCHGIDSSWSSLVFRFV